MTSHRELSRRRPPASLGVLHYTSGFCSPLVSGIALFLALGNLLHGSAANATDPFGVAKTRNTYTGNSSSRIMPGDDILLGKYGIADIWNRKEINASALKVVENGNILVRTGQAYLRSAATHQAKSSYIPAEAVLAETDRTNGQAKVDEGQQMVAEGERVMQLLAEEEKRLAEELKSPLNQTWKGANGNVANGVVLATDGNTVKFMARDGRSSSLPVDRFDPQYSGLFRSALLQSWLSSSTHASQDAEVVGWIDHAPSISADEISSTWGRLAGLAADYDATPVSIKFSLLRAFDFDPGRGFYFYEIDIAGFGQAVLRSTAALPQEKIYALPLKYVGTAPVTTVGGENKMAGVFELEKTSARGSREQLVKTILPILESILHFMRTTPDKRAELYAGFLDIEHQADISNSYTFAGSQLWSDTRDFFEADVIAHSTDNLPLWTKAEAQPPKTVDVGKLSF